MQPVAGLDPGRAARRDRLLVADDQRAGARRAAGRARARARPRRRRRRAPRTRPPRRRAAGSSRSRRAAAAARARLSSRRARSASGSKVAPWSERRDHTAKKTMLKNSTLCGHAADHREGGQHHRHGAAQARPAEDDALGRESARRRWPAPSASGRATTTSTRASTVPSTSTSPSWLGNTSRPSVRNSAICATHASAVVEGGDRAACAGIVRAAERQPGEVDREEARAVQHVGAAEREGGGRHRGHRVEPGGREPHRAGTPTPPASRRPARPPAPIPSSRSEQPPPCRRGRSPGSWIQSMKPSTSRTATGSLKPASRLERAGEPPPAAWSRAAARRSPRRRWRRGSTPSSSPSSVEKSNSQAATSPVISAVTIVPSERQRRSPAAAPAGSRVARRSGRPRTGSAPARSTPDRPGQLVVAELDPAGPVRADRSSRAPGTGRGRARAGGRRAAMRPARRPAARPRRGSAGRRSYGNTARVSGR